MHQTLKISHTTSYHYDAPVPYALQKLRLVPKTGQGQRVVDWSLVVDGGTVQASYDDHYGNLTHLVRVDEGATTVTLTSAGTVDVYDQAGVTGPHFGHMPLWQYETPTMLTQPTASIRTLVKDIRGQSKRADEIELLHTASAAILAAVDYQVGTTDAATSANDALEAGRGVCQDHAHLMVTVARLLGHPARYVSGYLMMDDRIEQDATHAWAEVHIAGLGWVGFDVSNAICPDGRYVRLAVGRDYTDAAPIHGVRLGDGHETLAVHLQVQQ